MKVNELEKVVFDYQQSLEEKSGAAVVFSSTGPVGMKVIYALLETIKEHEKRIHDLESKPPATFS